MLGSTFEVNLHRIGKSIGVIELLALFMFLTYGIVWSQEPLGEPNEVWVTTSSGDTMVVGEDVEFQIYIANDVDILDISCFFIISSSDGANWDLSAQPPDTTLNIYTCTTNPAALISTSRFWGQEVEIRSFWCGPVYDTSEQYHFSGNSFSPPHGPPGPLEHALSIHFQPTAVGTICVDSLPWPPATIPLIFNGDMIPAWNGPFCFTVIESPEGDINCDGHANIVDAVYLLNWIFQGGPPPCR
jgi:hypothetical protein